MKHVMIDLETLGTQPGSVILSIGAVLFDPAKPVGECLGDELYVVVSRQSCEAAKLEVSQDTLEWWERQSPEARIVLTQALGEDSTAIGAALKELADFIPVGAKVWSNGANFDQPLLDVAYNRCGISLPWKYWNSRCYRTILSLCKNEKAIRPETVLAHNALEDAKWQARHMVNVAQLEDIQLN